MFIFAVLLGGLYKWRFSAEDDSDESKVKVDIFVKHIKSNLRDVCVYSKSDGEC